MAECLTNLNLACVPPLPDHVARPWDAADEYLLLETDGDSPGLLVNDRFGALFCARPDWQAWTDSDSARRSWQANATDNNLSWSPKRVLTHLSDLAPDTPQALIKMPKSFDQLCYWLDQIAAVSPDASLWLAGMAKHIPVSWLKYLQTNSGEYHQYPVRRKARLIQIKHWQGSGVKRLSGYKTQSGLTLTGLPGVFAREKQDIASHLLLANMPAATNHASKPGAHLIDLGCGNGLLALSFKQLWPDLMVTAIDDSQCAAESCRINAGQNELDIRVIHNDSLSGLSLNADVIVCNPPFHDGHRQSTDIAVRMFRDSAEQLVSGGELWVIANRHLPYFAQLKRCFGRVKTVASDPRFNLFLCIK